jgi:hypothetical protein
LVPEDADWLKDQLAVLLSDDPELATLLRGAHPRNVDTSGERGSLGIDDEPADAAEAD